MARNTAFQKAINKAMSRDERVSVLVTLARGVKVVKKLRTVNGQKAHWVKLDGDEDVYRIAPDANALNKLNEYADGKAGAQSATRKQAGILVQVLEADEQDGTAQAQQPRPAERTGEGFPALEDLDDTTGTVEAVTPEDATA